MSAKKKKKKSEVVGLLGVGLDNTDGHKRLTRSEDMLLVGGSEETHTNMQNIALRFTEGLHKRGKRLPDASVDEVIDLLNKAADR